jgi:hypothetical protein
MKVLAWNLSHQIREKQNLDGLPDLFDAMGVDTILLNEYVDGASRGPFLEGLVSQGYEHQLVSFTPARHNQVLAASRLPFTLGDILPPTFDGSAVSNFLHIRFEHTNVELVGLRVPAYVTAQDRRAYRAELLAIMAEAESRGIVFAGDLNEDPFRRAKLSLATSMQFPACPAYSLPNPSGRWSYINKNGSATSRIDHALHTRGVEVRDARYVEEAHGMLLAGAATAGAVSDHAALVFVL